MRLIIGLFWHTREQWNFNQDVVMVKKMIIIYQEGWTRWCRSKEYSSQCRGDKRWGFSPWVGRAPRVGSGNPLQYSWGGNSVDRGAWRATVHGTTKSQARLCNYHFISHLYMTPGKIIALTIQTFVGKVMSLVFNMLSRLVTASLLRSKSFNFMAAVTIHLY